jgi:hypothetical protein
MRRVERCERQVAERDPQGIVGGQRVVPVP